MYNAIKKFGWANVKHEIILTTESKEEIEKYERQYITEIYHSNDKNFGYNIDCGGNYAGKVSEETKLLKRSLSLGENNPAFGKHWYNNGFEQILAFEKPDETCTEGFEPYTFTMPKDIVSKVAKQHEGLRWWTNDSIEILSKTCPSRNWKLGKLPLSEKTKLKLKNRIVSQKTRDKLKQYCGEKSSTFGKKWYNNGKEEVLTKECPIGFVKGRLKNKAK